MSKRHGNTSGAKVDMMLFFLAIGDTKMLIVEGIGRNF
jgi:hypothetical protein